MLRILAVTNIYPNPHNPASGAFVLEQIKGLKQIGLNVEVIFVDRANKGMSAYLNLGKDVAARITSFGPDLVHVMYGGVMADKVTRAANGCPSVVSFCGSDLLGQPSSGLIRKMLANYGVLASHRAARRASGVVVKSKNLKDALPENLRTSKVRIIPNGVDLKRFRRMSRVQCRSKLKWDPGKFHVLFPTTSADSLKRPELAQAAVDAINRSKVPTEMHELQGVPSDDVPLWLNASDVLLLTSLHEGSPNVVKEALACEIPVVSVDVGDVHERIQGIQGCYLGLPDAADLAGKLRLVYEGPRRIAARARMQELSVERTALRLKEFYEELLAIYQIDGKTQVAPKNHLEITPIPEKSINRSSLDVPFSRVIYDQPHFHHYNRRRG